MEIGILINYFYDELVLKNFQVNPVNHSSVPLDRLSDGTIIPSAKPKAFQRGGGT